MILPRARFIPARRGARPARANPARRLLLPGMIVVSFLIAAGLLALAAYAQHRIGAHTASRGAAQLTRAVLALVGIALGALGARYAQDTAGAVLAFVAGFGLVHFPAAVILFVKRARGTGKS